MAHTHVIDGKLVSFDDNDCPMCNPAQTQLPREEKDEQLPRTYRKHDTVVLKINRGRMVTTTYWAQEKCYLMSIQHMITDNDDKVMLDRTGKAIWQKDTVRMSPQLLKEWLNQTSSMYSDIENQGVIPKRD